jgi:hypothetical protein
VRNDVIENLSHCQRHNGDVLALEELPNLAYRVAAEVETYKEAFFRLVRIMAASNTRRQSRPSFPHVVGYFQFSFGGSSSHTNKEYAATEISRSHHR